MGALMMRSLLSYTAMVILAIAVGAQPVGLTREGENATVKSRVTVTIMGYEGAELSSVPVKLSWVNNKHYRGRSFLHEAGDAE
jgi:hypothetical protein